MSNRNIRWVIIIMVFIATGLNFLDRQVLSIAIIKIQKELHLTDTQYGMINMSFLISYALMFTIGGRLIDIFGSKMGLAFSVGIWSIANGLHGLIGSFYHLLAFRFLLGVGEGACFPGAAKVVNEWFNDKERALANGIAIGGSAIGAVIAPPLTTWVVNEYGWRESFVFPGLAGIVWVACWLLLPGREKKPLMNAFPIVVTPFLQLLAQKQVWVFILIRFLLDPVFYFLMFWIPKYLHEQRHISFEQVGSLFWIPFLALGVSNILGGWFSDLLIKRNVSVNKARKIVMGCAALLTMTGPLIEMVSTVEMAIALMALMMFAHGCWITNYITAISDVFGKQATSTVVGLSGTAGAIAGLLLNPLIGTIIQKYSYKPIWIASGLMYPLAFAVLVLFIPVIQSLQSKPRTC